MSLYGWVLILSIIFPLIFSFHPKISFFKNWGRTFLAGLVVAIPFWIWDAAATNRGDWSFNGQYVGQLKIGGLPIEEILFFLIIPFCCLFIWQIMENLLKSKDERVKISNKVGVAAAGLIAVMAWLLRDKFYTLTILSWSAATLIIGKALKSNVFQTVRYWKWIAITFIPFLIVNGVLTSIPVVMYSSQAIIGIRLGTIPIEDFWYSWSLLTLNLMVYEKMGKKD